MSEEIGVVIQMSKFCPFCREERNREGCRLWSAQFEACGAAVNHLALAQVAEALQAIAALLVRQGAAVAEDVRAFARKRDSQDESPPSPQPMRS
ncbi:MAG: hypothetical protein FJ290_24240 [Planctomycetes bacterium]|nr:hypothetical protein [Planctomycetota bacterium]